MHATPRVHDLLAGIDSVLGPLANPHIRILAYERVLKPLLPQLPMIQTRLRRGERVYQTLRSEVHPGSAHRLFEGGVSDLCRPEADAVTQPGRANWMAEPIFYGSISLLPNGEMTVEELMDKACQEEPEATSRKGLYYLTVSTWEIARSFSVLAVPPASDLESFSSRFQNEAEAEFMTEMARAFAKPQPEHADLVKTNWYAGLAYTEADGLVYPGIRAGGTSACVALPPDVAERNLVLKRVTLYEIRPDGGVTAWKEVATAQVKAAPWMWFRRAEPEKIRA